MTSALSEDGMLSALGAYNYSSASKIGKLLGWPNARLIIGMPIAMPVLPSNMTPNQMQVFLAFMESLNAGN